MNKKKGFTLVELLAVIVILAIIITVASSSISKVIQKSKEDTAKEMQAAIKEAALTKVMGSIYLEKCSKTFSEEMLNNNINNLNLDTNCTKVLTVEDLINENLFEDSRGNCKKNEKVIVYHYNDGTNSEYKAYVSDQACLD